jgi:FkbM family methyltransferase
MKRLKVFAKKVLPKRLVSAVRKVQAIRKVFVVDHSQAGEATLLRKLVKDFECQKWIIDVGANDGVTISNSLPFVKLGWRAILIEPVPAVFKKLIANCGDCENVTCLQIACCDKCGEADLYFGSDGEDGILSTLCTSDNEWFNSARSSNSVKVRTDTITNILKRYHAPNRPGILMVDCEGMDYEVLLGLDFGQFRPTVIITEEYEWEPEKHAAKYALLIRANYSLVQKVGCNTFWIDRSAKRRDG